MDELLEQVPGFGQCGRCLFNTSGPAELCFACARRTMEPLATRRCMVCDRPYAPDENTCGNPLCNRSDRWFSWNFAISMRTGQLKAAINRYKYEGQWGWALIFGRVVAGFLEEQGGLFREFDVITASPTYVGPDGRSFDHTRMVLERAAAEVPPGTVWPFDITGEPLIVKTGPTPPMVGNGYQDRRRIAEGSLRDALRVTRDVRGQRALVYDDVFTDGLTLNEVGRALRLDGATEVCGVALCRQPYGGAALPGLPTGPAGFSEETLSDDDRSAGPSRQGQHTVNYGAVTACSLFGGRIMFAFRWPHSEAADVCRRRARNRRKRPTCALSHYEKYGPLQQAR